MNSVFLFYKKFLLALGCKSTCLLQKSPISQTKIDIVYGDNDDVSWLYMIIAPVNILWKEKNVIKDRYVNKVTEKNKNLDLPLSIARACSMYKTNEKGLLEANDATVLIILFRLKKTDIYGWHSMNTWMTRLMIEKQIFSNA
jgi:hypothetical protein